jgi:hypothetical protein
MAEAAAIANAPLRNFNSRTDFVIELSPESSSQPTGDGAG